MEIPRVREWMEGPTETFGEGDSMRQAVNWLAKESTAAAPVVDSQGRVVGLLTEKDALRTIAHWTYDRVAGGTVGDHMSPLRVRLAPDMDLLTAVRAFLECNFACLPVIEDERYVGQMTRDRLLQGMVAWATAIDAEQDERQAPQSVERPSSIEEMQRVAASHTPDQLARIFSRD
ncbi:MAG: CBS domain-containing protein [bacterium]|nr:CBS domain-containing protein [bacterium]